MKKKNLLTMICLLFIPCVFLFTACGNNKPEEQVNHTHNYGSEYCFDNDYHWQQCDECLETTDKTQHLFSDWTELKPATALENGKEERTCQVCDFKETRNTYYEYRISYYKLYGVENNNPTSYNAGQDTIILSEPERENYIFEGWYTRPNFLGSKVTRISKGTKGNWMLYAKWIPAKNYTISYELNGGTNSSSNPKTYNLETNITLKAPTKKGYTFTGWTGSNGNTAQMNVTISKEMTGDLHYTANWELTEYTITYELNGGTNNDSNPTSYTMNSETITLLEPTKLLYSFEGWYDNEDCTGSAITEIPSGSTGNITLYAKWRDGLSDFYYMIGDSGVTITGVKNSTKTSYRIPRGVTSIGDYAFSNCDYLTSITIPASVTSIESNAFSGCDNLTSVTFEENSSLTSIGSYVFDSCSNLTSITIPNSVTNIGDGAFSGCINLTSIAIPNSVTSIGDFAFNSCRRLSSVTIPNSVVSIGLFVFSYCDNLTSVTFEENSSLTSIGHYAFAGCPGLKSVTIPNSVTSIGSYVFASCYSLTSVTLSNSITQIQGNVFEGCGCLTSITIPSSVTLISAYAFFATGLSRVIFENPNGWVVNGVNISSTDLSDPLTAAGYLQGSYLNGEWTRK